MTAIAIATVDACRPAPFTSRPFLALVTTAQVGTPARHVRHFEADASLDEMDAEARALEMTGEIDEAALASDWTLDRDGIAAAAAQHEADLDGVAFDDVGMGEAEADMVEEIEPLA